MLLRAPPPVSRRCGALRFQRQSCARSSIRLGRLGLLRHSLQAHPRALRAHSRALRAHSRALRAHRAILCITCTCTCQRHVHLSCMCMCTRPRAQPWAHSLGPYCCHPLLWPAMWHRRRHSHRRRPQGPRCQRGPPHPPPPPIRRKGGAHARTSKTLKCMCGPIL